MHDTPKLADLVTVAIERAGHTYLLIYADNFIGRARALRQGLQWAADARLNFSDFDAGLVAQKVEWPT